jgi:hypothetical protein
VCHQVSNALYLWSRFRDSCSVSSWWLLFRLTSDKVVSSECVFTNVVAGRSSLSSCCFVLFFALISVRLWPCVKLRLQSKILGQQCHFWKYTWFVVRHDVKASWYSEPELCFMKRSQLVLNLVILSLYRHEPPSLTTDICQRASVWILSLMHCIIEKSCKNSVNL